jgi:Flp pilus assembly pilin Flp
MGEATKIRMMREAVQFLNERSNKLTRMLALLKGFQNDESGQGMVEYLLIIALVALAATAGMSSAASYINSAFIRIGQKLGGTSARRELRSNQSDALGEQTS